MLGSKRLAEVVVVSLSGVSSSSSSSIASSSQESAMGDFLLGLVWDEGDDVEIFKLFIEDAMPPDAFDCAMCGWAMASSLHSRQGGGCECRWTLEPRISEGMTVGSVTSGTREDC